MFSCLLHRFMFNVSGFLNARASSWLSCARFKRNPQRVAGVTLVVTSYPQAMALRTRPPIERLTNSGQVDGVCATLTDNKVGAE